ncbi:MFS transporter [Methylobacterium brachiatum]|uniref:MFS transporter n=1 Tax=Methylobacterium brachiatum TaxID=269660 RepID=UPI0008E6D4E0|nr:MFS transporter [Methylobacterium brachiatum]SFJ57606.1 MFS transporter, putative metabolite:H+ symporter [Methylobacterium brachiatum]
MPLAATSQGDGRPVVSDIAARLERLPMSRYQRKIFAIIASAWLVDQIDVALLTFLLGSIVVAFGLSPTEAGQLAAMTFAGQLVGNIAAGTASDRFGRKAVFQVTMVVWGLASLAAATAWSLPVLMACRFLIGVGVGGEAPVAQAMVSEIVPASVRGKYIAILEGFWAVGYVLSGAISFFVLPYLGWRWAFVVVGLLSLVVLAVRRTMPESPRWLAESGRHAEAEAVMATMERAVERATGRPLPPVTPQIAAAVAETVAEPIPGPRLSAVATLFAPAYRMRTVMAFGLWFFALIGFFGLNSWIAVLLKERGFSIVGSVGFVTLITLGGIPGFAAAAVLLERIGRKPTTSLFLVCAAAAAWLYGNAGGEPVLTVAGLAVTWLFVAGFVMQFFMFGMWSCLYAYTPELYPTRARATGAGFASAFGRIGAILGPMIVPVLVRDYGPATAFQVGAGGFLIAALLVLTLGVETRGKVLEAVSH